MEPDLLDLVRALKGSRWQVFTMGVTLYLIMIGLEPSCVVKDAGPR